MNQSIQEMQMNEDKWEILALTYDLNLVMNVFNC